MQPQYNLIYLNWSLVLHENYFAHQHPPPSPSVHHPPINSQLFSQGSSNKNLLLPKHNNSINDNNYIKDTIEDYTKDNIKGKHNKNNR